MKPIHPTSLPNNGISTSYAAITSPQNQCQALVLPLPTRVFSAIIFILQNMKVTQLVKQNLYSLPSTKVLVLLDQYLQFSLQQRRISPIISG